MAVEHLYACVAVGESSYEVSFRRERDPQATFEFALCRKQTPLGDLAIDQLWMPLSSLYGQRNRAATNYKPLVGLWWSMCGNARTRDESAIQEIYLLAKILPRARSNGSRRVFLDSNQTVPADRSRRLRGWVGDLEEMLKGSQHQEYDEFEFHRSTGAFLGPPTYASEVWDRYQHFRGLLFGAARDEMRQEGLEAGNAALGNWDRVFKSAGRHSGKEIDKKVLDILSYECRAAIHQCYSAVWSVLLPAIRQQYAFSPASASFHRLWHFDLRRDVGCSETHFHLFHGHILGLHPACGLVLLTPTGGKLFMRFLREGSSASYFRVLHALAVAIGYYSMRHNDTCEARKGGNSVRYVADVVATKEREADKKRGSRLRRSRD